MRSEKLPEIVAYLRVSTDKQEIESQKMAVLEYANREGWQISRFVEIVISSRKKAQKTHLDEEIAKLKEGDLLLISELSRVGRSLGQIITLVDELARRKIRLVAIKEGIKLDGKEDHISKALVGMFGVLAEMERSLISQRTKDGQKRAVAQGKKIGRPKGSTGKSKLDGKEKEIAAYLDSKVSKAAIARMLGVHIGTLDTFIKRKNLEAGDLLKKLM